MFETGTQQKKSSLLWKILPAAVAIFAVIVVVIVYLGQDHKAPEGPVTGVFHRGDPDFEWYSKYVGLESRGIKMAKNFAGNRMVIFSGVVKNGGEKTLDTVEVKVTLFNKSEPVFDAVRYAVRPGPYTPPIPSLQDRAFTLYVDDFPSKWEASRAEMEIEGFRFVEHPGPGPK